VVDGACQLVSEDAQRFPLAVFARQAGVTAHSSASGASVWVKGAILMVPDLAMWAEQYEALYRTMSGEAVLSSYERELRVTIKPTDRQGHLKHAGGDHPRSYEPNASVRLSARPDVSPGRDPRLPSDRRRISDPRCSEARWRTLTFNLTCRKEVGPGKLGTTPSA
jgi:hypothetical protein